MRAISNILAVLIIVGIVIALSVVVANMVFTQVSRMAQNPTHVQLTSNDVVKLGSSALKVKIMFNNPTSSGKRVCFSWAVFYTSGFNNQIFLTVNPTSECITIYPGEAGKLEFVASSSSSLSSGVAAVWVSVTDVASGKSYTDVVLLPVK